MWSLIGCYVLISMPLSCLLATLAIRTLPIFWTLLAGDAGWRSLGERGPRGSAAAGGGDHPLKKTRKGREGRKEERKKKRRESNRKILAYLLAAYATTI